MVRWQLAPVRAAALTPAGVIVLNLNPRIEELNSRLKLISRPFASL
jgi:hypothetical protein